MASPYDETGTDAVDYDRPAIGDLEALIHRTERRLGQEQEQAAKARQAAEDASRTESQTSAMLKGLCQLRDSINPPTNFNTPAMAHGSVGPQYR